MISTGGSFLSVWRMVNCLTTILPKSAERREPPAHTRRKKAQLQNDERGWIWLEPVQLWLGLSRDRLGNYERLACFDRTGAEVGDYTAISTALAAETRARAEAEARATAEAEARAAEAGARARAEARIRELEERLRQN